MKKLFLSSMIMLGVCSMATAQNAATARSKNASEVKAQKAANSATPQVSTAAAAETVSPVAPQATTSTIQSVKSRKQQEAAAKVGATKAAAVKNTDAQDADIKAKAADVKKNQDK